MEFGSPTCLPVAFGSQLISRVHFHCNIWPKIQIVKSPQKRHCSHTPMKTWSGEVRPHFNSMRPWTWRRFHTIKALAAGKVAVGAYLLAKKKRARFSRLSIASMIPVHPSLTIFKERREPTSGGNFLRDEHPFIFKVNFQAFKLTDGAVNCDQLDTVREY